MTGHPRNAMSKPDRQRADLAKTRLRALRVALNKLGVSHAVITNPTDVGYLTGFLGGDSVLVVGGGKPSLISDSRYREELAAFTPTAKIVMRSGSMNDAIAGVLAALNDAGRLDGFAIQADHLTIGAETAIRAACKKRRVPVRSILHASGLITGHRMVKDASEIKLIRRAIDIQQNALMGALDHFKAGMSELDFTAELEYQMKVRGSTDPAFGTIVAAGPNGSLPHYRPASARIKANSTLLVDWGASFKGYRGDMTRTFGVGRWPKQMREIYAVVLDAHEAAAAKIAPGITGAELDAIARKVITGAGYGDAFAHSLGHGLGMDVHEAPRLSSQAEADILEEGNVVTIEPGIYLPGIGGVRIEDDYAVTARGRKNLCTLPKDIEWATI